MFVSLNYSNLSFYFLIFLNFIRRITVTHRGLLLLLSTWRNGSMRYKTHSLRCLGRNPNTVNYYWGLYTMKCHLAFAFVAQLSAAKKLQRKGGLQTVYSGRYLKASCSLLSILRLRKCQSLILCTFRDIEEWEWCPRGWRKLWRSYKECEYCFKPNQGARSQTHIFNSNSLCFVSQLTLMLWISADS